MKIDPARIVFTHSLARLKHFIFVEMSVKHGSIAGVSKFLSCWQFISRFAQFHMCVIFHCGIAHEASSLSGEAFPKFGHMTYTEGKRQNSCFVRAKFLFSCHLYRYLSYTRERERVSLFKAPCPTGRRRRRRRDKKWATSKVSILSFPLVNFFVTRLGQWRNLYT